MGELPSLPPLPPIYTCYTDCLNLQRARHLTRRQQLSFKKPYAGIYLFIPNPHFSCLHKVKAHRADSPHLSAFERFCKAGGGIVQTQLPKPARACIRGPPEWRKKRWTFAARLLVGGLAPPRFVWYSLRSAACGSIASCPRARVDMFLAFLAV